MDTSESSSKRSVSHLNLYLSSLSEDYQSDSNPSTSHPPETSHVRSDSTEDRFQPVQMETGNAGRTEELKEKIKQEEFVRRQHERTIEDLRNRMKHLEQELVSAAKGGREKDSVAEATTRLEAAIKERDEARKDCQSLQTHLAILRQSLPPVPSPSHNAPLERRASDLRRKLLDMEHSNSQLFLKLASLRRDSEENDPKLSKIEQRISLLESAFELETRKTASIQSRLRADLPNTQPRSHLIDAVTRQIAENEDKVAALEAQLATAETTYDQLKRTVFDRKLTPCEESEDYSEHCSYSKLRPSHGSSKKSEPILSKKGKARTGSERPKKPTARASK